MHYIVVTGFDRPIRVFMWDSPAIAAIRILHDHGLGTIKQLTDKIDHLPAEFGPISDRFVADELVRKLCEKGIQAHAEERS